MTQNQNKYEEDNLDWLNDEEDSDEEEDEEEVECVSASAIQDIFMRDKNNAFITANKNLIQSIGLNETIIYQELVSKLMYYQDAMGVNSAEFFCTNDDLESSVGLGQTAISSAVKRLKEFGLISVSIKGIPRKTYYEILDIKYFDDKKDEEKHILYFYINNGVKIIKLLKKISKLRVEQANDKSQKLADKIKDVRKQIKALKQPKFDINVENTSLHGNQCNSEHESVQYSIDNSEIVDTNQCNIEHESINKCTDINEQVHTNQCNIAGKPVRNNNNNKNKSEERLEKNNLKEKSEERIKRSSNVDIVPAETENIFSKSGSPDKVVTIYSKNPSKWDNAKEIDNEPDSLKLTRQLREDGKIPEDSEYYSEYWG